MQTMKIPFACSFNAKFGQQKLEEMCCLYVLGELNLEEREQWDEHLRVCEGCGNLVSEYQQIILFDLPTIAVAQLDGTALDEPPQADQVHILASIRAKAAAMQARTQQLELCQASSEQSTIRVKPKFRLPVGPLIGRAGWSVAAGLLFALLWTSPKHQNQVPSQSLQTTAARSTATQIADQTALLKSRIATAEQREEELSSRLNQSELKSKNAEAAYLGATVRARELAAANSELEARTAEVREKLTQTEAELELARKSLNDEIAFKDVLKTDLTDTYERLEREKGEVARLQRAALTTPVHFSSSDRPLGEAEAKEILGARDLHIVDVYDVDNFGKSSRAYGRIYFVNQHELVFYAFDLSKLDNGHKVVAFQAWGFHQPQSTQVESLGLFYLENASLNRWTLRVSDARILSRIDSLFVTVEPPGGSKSPKGKRLLMASLAGPPNHP
jgi:anti-sigma factor RsiW